MAGDRAEDDETERVRAEVDDGDTAGVGHDAAR
jgi:hypothetical protein